MMPDYEGVWLVGVSIDLTTVIFFAVGLVLLYALGWLLLVPFKVLLRFLFNGLLGGAMLMLINLFGSPMGLRIAINPITAMAAGLLGVPGVVTLMALQSIL